MQAHRVCHWHPRRRFSMGKKASSGCGITPGNRDCDLGQFHHDSRDLSKRPCQRRTGKRCWRLPAKGVLSSSTATQLQLIGDINGDVILPNCPDDCDTGEDSLPLRQSHHGGGHRPFQIVLQGLIANPDGAPCFDVTAAGYTFVTSGWESRAHRSDLTSRSANRTIHGHDEHL